MGSQKPAESGMESVCEKLASLAEGDLAAAPVTPRVFRVDSVDLVVWVVTLPPFLSALCASFPKRHAPSKSLTCPDRGELFFGQG